MKTVSFEVAGDAPHTKDAFLRATLRQDVQALGGPMKEYMEHRTGIFASSGVTSAAQLSLPGLGTFRESKELEGLLATGSRPNGAFAVAHEKIVHNILLSRSEASGYYIFRPAYAALNPDGTSALPPVNGSEDSCITVVLMLAHPLSGGVRAYLGYLNHPLDLEVMARHLQFLERDLAATEPLAKFLKPNGKRALGTPKAGALKGLEEAKNPTILSPVAIHNLKAQDADVVDTRFIKGQVVGAHHFTGTCSMLPHEMGGVVDSSLRIYGTMNLRVCDASVIPLVPPANPQATVYGVAEHAAKLIKEVHDWHAIYFSVDHARVEEEASRSE
ncbi:hypothetical protein S7711_04169, partial [Stachybotrys chartarum IBT 7711]